MKQIALTKLSLAELQELQGQIAVALPAKRRDEIAALREELKALAAKRGFALADVVGKRPRAYKPSTAVHVNPDNPEQTWNGRGRPPKWWVGKADG